MRTLGSIKRENMVNYLIDSLNKVNADLKTEKSRNKILEEEYFSIIEANQNAHQLLTENRNLNEEAQDLKLKNKDLQEKIHQLNKVIYNLKNVS